MTTTKHLRWISLAIPFALLVPACAEDESASPEVEDTQQAVSTTGFTATYTGQGANASTCNTSFTITGQEPSGSGTNPVFLYMIGTGETATNASATAAVAGMAAKGFVAATIAYDSGTFNNCGTLDGKAKCIFNSASSTSAVAVLSTILLIFGLVTLTSNVSDFDGLSSVGQALISIAAIGGAWWLTKERRHRSEGDDADHDPYQ